LKLNTTQIKVCQSCTRKSYDGPTQILVAAAISFWVESKTLIVVLFTTCPDKGCSNVWFTGYGLNSKQGHTKWVSILGNLWIQWHWHHGVGHGSCWKMFS